MTFEKPREIAFRLLQQRDGGGGYIEQLLETGLASTNLIPSDRGLVQELAYGTVRWQGTLDWLIARKAPGRTQKPALQNLLRLGLYQLFWLSRIPDHAAVHETVSLAKRQGWGAQAGFINAVLRGYLREREPTERLLADLKVSNPPVGYSHPEWLYRRWLNRLAQTEVTRLLEWNNTPPATAARVSLRISPEELRELWVKENVEAKLLATPWAADTLVYELESFPPLATLPSFRQGFFYLQDPSILLAVNELNPQPGESILDYCAAPGGKTTYIADRMRNQGVVIAHDTSEERLRRVTENCARMGVTNVQVTPPSMLNNLSTLFDRILIDAPCSNTGVMRRRVDLRWRIREQEISRLRATQLQLLREVVPRLKPGGTLVYSTCSLEPDENSSVVQEFLKDSPVMQLQLERSLTPWEHGVDGAYVARMIRRE